MALSLILTYFICWFILYQIAGLIPSKYLKKATQRNNAITILHAIISPLLCIFCFIPMSDPFGYESTVTEAMTHACLVSAGYYLFSIITLIRLEEKFPTFMVIHHICGIAFMSFMGLFPELPAFIILGLLVHGAGVPYHLHLIYKETPGSHPATISFWYDMNYYSWIFFRFLLQGTYLSAIILYELSYNAMPIGAKIFVFTALGISFYFNVHWMILIIKKRRAKRLAISPRRSL